MELDSIGLFQDGDDPRHIDWSATARTGRAHVRRFLASVQRPIVVLVDLRPSMYFGTANCLLAAQACLQAAALSAFLQRKQEPIVIGNFDGEPAMETISRASRSRRNRAANLAQLLTAYHQRLNLAGASQPTLADALQHYWPSIPFSHDVVVISDFSQCGQTLDETIRMRRQRSVHGLVINDPIFRNGWISGNYPGRLEPQAGAEVYRMPRHQQQNQQDLLKRWRAELISTLRGAGLDTVWEGSEIAMAGSAVK